MDKEKILVQLKVHLEKVIFLNTLINKIFFKGS